MSQVDNAISAICGLSHADLADKLYRDNFGSGMSPSEQARETLDNEDFPFDDDMF